MIQRLLFAATLVVAARSAPSAFLHPTTTPEEAQPASSVATAEAPYNNHHERARAAATEPDGEKINDVLGGNFVSQPLDEKVLVPCQPLPLPPPPPSPPP